MNDVVKYIGAIVSLAVVFVSIVYNFAIMREDITKNTTDIAEHRLTGKTVRSHGTRLTKIETELFYATKEDNEQQVTIKEVRVRVRNLEKGK